ncbi:hypothetical protein CLV98_101672 [Dyadobacter jejuensis]|uniref:Uncharacterized protein n=1 Tax=Dyadobacter jejuensis TaxID=1082580 RepID=A0A316ASJ3_9BACT|nr:hypothetical protein [Dyadobacter jejuensis]PWJ60488.1 hypothetical protein CLV98_101672 [Dyadobacter jejuensis]
MFSTIFLLFLIGFIVWMNTSKRIAWPDKNRTLTYMASSPNYSLVAVGGLFLMATTLCVASMGLGSGLFAAVVVLMAVGSVSVLFFPFRYFGLKGIIILYICSLVIELLTL